MLRLSELFDFLKPVAPDAMYGPGPDPGDDIPGRQVVVTPTPGPGLTLDGIYDQQGFQVLSIGRAMDYDNAEALAFALDKRLLQFTGGRLGSTRVLYFNRVGSPPTLLRRDEADRYNFVCTYIHETPTGIEEA